MNLFPPKRQSNADSRYPTCLNMYENYPFWFTFFTNLDFRVCFLRLPPERFMSLVLNPFPSESECYPAKLAHGHVTWLIQNQGVKFIFYPVSLMSATNFRMQTTITTARSLLLTRKISKTMWKNCTIHQLPSGIRSWHLLPRKSLQTVW